MRLLIADGVGDVIAHHISLFVGHLGQRGRLDRFRHLAASDSDVGGIAQWRVLRTRNPGCVDYRFVISLTTLARRKCDVGGVGNGSFLFDLHLWNEPFYHITAVSQFGMFHGGATLLKRAGTHKIDKSHALRQGVAHINAVYIPASHWTCAQNTAPDVAIVFLYQNIRNRNTRRVAAASQPVVDRLHNGLTLAVKTLAGRRDRIIKTAIGIRERFVVRPIVGKVW